MQKFLFFLITIIPSIAYARDTSPRRIFNHAIAYAILCAAMWIIGKVLGKIADYLISKIPDKNSNKEE